MLGMLVLWKSLILSTARDYRFRDPFCQLSESAKTIAVFRIKTAILAGTRMGMKIKGPSECRGQCLYERLVKESRVPAPSGPRWAGCLPPTYHRCWKYGIPQFSQPYGFGKRYPSCLVRLQ